jgi:quinol monooxygenase YgiN
MAVHVFARWHVKQGQLGMVLELLPPVVRASRAEAGNLFYQVHQDTTDPSVLVLFEGYADEGALAEHRSSEHFRAIVVGQIVPLLERRELVLATPLAM